MHDRVEPLGQRRLVRRQPVGDVRLDQREARLAREVRDVVLGAGDEVVDRDDGGTAVDQRVNEVRAGRTRRHR